MDEEIRKEQAKDPPERPVRDQGSPGSQHGGTDEDIEPLNFDEDELEVGAGGEGGYESAGRDEFTTSPSLRCLAMCGVLQRFPRRCV